jgi:hypothetical protein
VIFALILLDVNYLIQSKNSFHSGPLLKYFVFKTVSFNSNQSDEEEMDPPEDLSSLVKVEMEEGFGPVIDNATTTGI